MNICTYVTSISMDPKLMLVAVYHGTKTHENISATKKVLLQLLSQEQAPLTRLCGHTSGKATDKMARLQKKTPVATVDGIPYMTQCAGYVILEVQQLLAVGGDHDLAICSVIQHKNLRDTPPLTTDYLRAHGLRR